MNGTNNTTKRCSVDGCEDKHRARGFCVKHYHRLVTHGSIESKKQLGSTHHAAKLDEEGVRAIRAEYFAGGVTQKALADRYGVSESTVNKVISGQRWTHVEEK